jgi:uncharacterized membrane protein (DUF485 family)
MSIIWRGFAVALSKFMLYLTLFFPLLFSNNTPLMKAAIWNKINVVKLLLERKADVNAQKDK